MRLALLLGAALATVVASGAAHAKRRYPRGFSGNVPALLRALPTPMPSGELALEATNLREKVHVNLLNLDGTFDAQALDTLAGVFRCKRTGDRRPIDPRLLEVLSHIYDRYGKPVQLLSGYRNQENTYSFHYRGSAADIRVPGVSIRSLRRFAETLDSGTMGVGLYPRSGFVHVDVRPPPSYRWVDNSTTPERERSSARRRRAAAPRPKS